MLNCRYGGASENKEEEEEVRMFLKG